MVVNMPICNIGFIRNNPQCFDSTDISRKSAPDFTLLCAALIASRVNMFFVLEMENSLRSMIQNSFTSMYRLSKAKLQEALLAEL